MDNPIKMIQDVFPGLGSSFLLDKQNSRLDEVMICGVEGSSSIIYRLTNDKDEKICVGIDIKTNRCVPLTSEQTKLYNESRALHEKRMLGNKSAKTINYKENGDDYRSFNIDEMRPREVEENTVLELFIDSRKYSIKKYCWLYNRHGDSLVASVSETEMHNGLSMQKLYDEVKFLIFLPEYTVIYEGEIVRIEKLDTEYLLFIYPYPMEMLQSTKCQNASFENVMSPFPALDFLVNHADVDVDRVNYPGSDKNRITDYMVVGLVFNLEMENCVIGNVRIGESVATSESFEELIPDASRECFTYVWVNVKSDSLYNAFESGKNLLMLAVDFISFLLKNDMYTDWYGTAKQNNTIWDMRNHYPKIYLGTAYYVENCILGESLVLEDENMMVPSSVKIDRNADYLFEYDWIECFFRKLYAGNKKTLRLQYALSWIIRAWNTVDANDRVIYCSTALEFIVNGEKGENIFDEYARRVGRSNFTKKERSEIIDNLFEKIEIEEIEGFSEEVLSEFKKSIKKIMKQKLTETNFQSKLDCLINRLNIPVSPREKELLAKARNIRNKLIHGTEMASFSTIETKNLCGITSRILMYKILDESSMG